MNVTVSLPVYKDKDTLGLTLSSLAKQRYRDFKLLIVYKHSSEDVLPIIDEYSKKMDIELIHQDYGNIERAMNLILMNFKGDLLINTDADAILTDNAIEDHVNLHQNNPNVGIASGDVSPPYNVKRKNGSILSFIDTFVDYPPLNPIMLEYEDYISSAGMVVKNPYYKKKESVIIQTISIAGVNMSLKKEAIKNFLLEEITLNGLRYEERLALYANQKNFSSVHFKGAMVKHIQRKSLSRGNYYYTGIEEGLSPYIFNRVYPINRSKLLLKMTQIEYFKLKSAIKKDSNNSSFFSGVLKGINLSINAMKNNLLPSEVNKILKEIKLGID
ncbi:MAG: glycosyltransferase family A protein [Thermoplasmata archaeon]